MTERSEGTIHDRGNLPQSGSFESLPFGNNEILRYKPQEIRKDPRTNKDVAPLLYVQGRNGDDKLPWTLEAFAKEQQREIIAIKYTGKLEGSAHTRDLETIASGSIVTEMDSLQADEIIDALNRLGIENVDAIAESRGAIRLVTAMQKKPDLFRDVYLAHPAGLDNRGYIKAHADAARQALNHAARKIMGKIEKHSSGAAASPRGRRWLRDLRGWRKEQKSVAHADIRSALALYAREHPDRQITIAGDKNDKAFRSERLAQNAGNNANIAFTETDWGGHGIGVNPQAIKEISSRLG